MKLKKIELLNIEKGDGGYEYIYGAFGISLFLFKKFYKITFTSDLPHWWWSEIQKQMVRKKIYFEDLLDKRNEKLDIGMGKVQCIPFTKEDEYIYGVSLQRWKVLLNKAVDKQKELSDDYKDEHGEVDLTKYSLFSG